MSSTVGGSPSLVQCGDGKKVLNKIDIENRGLLCYPPPSPMVCTERIPTAEERAQCIEDCIKLHGWVPAYNLAKTGLLNAICSGGTIAINQICKSKINCNKEVWEECYRSPDGGVLRSPDGGTDGGVLRSPLSVASPTPSVSDDGDDGDDGDENDDDQQDSDADEELREEIEQDFDECPDGC